MTTVLDRSRIEQEVSSIDLPSFPVWRDLQTRIDGVEFVAMEVDGSTFDIEANGAFEGRAHVLLNAPYHGVNGNILMSSLAVPADIHGSIHDKNVVFSDVSLRF